jgi:hypothetical protein
LRGAQRRGNPVISILFLYFTLTVQPLNEINISFNAILKKQTIPLGLLMTNMDFLFLDCGVAAAPRNDGMDAWTRKHLITGLT